MLTFNEHLSCTGKVQTSLYSWCHIIFTEILWKYNVIPFREEVRPTPVKWPAFTIYILGKIWQTLDGSYSHALLIQAGNICLWCCRLLPIGVSDLLAQYSQKWAQNHSLNCGSPLLSDSVEGDLVWVYLKAQNLARVALLWVQWVGKGNAVISPTPLGGCWDEFQCSENKAYFSFWLGSVFVSEA